MNQPTVSKTDLSKVFGSVVKVMQENRATLNAADEYNHNHGDNMVDTFQLITQAMAEKKASSPSTQLAYASQKLSSQAQTGSAKLYAEGLAQAAQKVKGQTRISPESAMTLVQALMGGQSAPSSQPQSQGGMGDLLGALMGGQSSPAAQPQSQGGLEDLMGALLGGSQAPAQPQSQPDAGDLLGSLLGGQQSAPQGQSGGMGDLLGALLGGQQAAQPQAAQPQGQGGGIDLATLLTAGAAFLKARQKGAGALEAIVQAVMAGSQMNNASHRQQSGQLVAGTLLNALSSVMGGAK